MLGAEPTTADWGLRHSSAGGCRAVRPVRDICSRFTRHPSPFQMTQAACQCLAVTSNLSNMHCVRTAASSIQAHLQLVWCNQFSHGAPHEPSGYALCMSTEKPSQYCCGHEQDQDLAMFAPGAIVSFISGSPAHTEMRLAFCWPFRTLPQDSLCSECWRACSARFCIHSQPHVCGHPAQCCRAVICESSSLFPSPLPSLVLQIAISSVCTGLFSSMHARTGHHCFRPTQSSFKCCKNRTAVNPPALCHWSLSSAGHFRPA